MKGEKELLKLVELFEIVVIPFCSAPLEIRELSNNGGDEDWVILSKKKYKDDVSDLAMLVHKITVCGFDRYKWNNVNVIITNHG